MFVQQNELLGKARKLFDDAKAILGNPDASAEELENTKKMVEDAKALQARAAQLSDVMTAAQQIAATTEAEQGADEQKGARMSNAKFKEWGDFLYAAWRAEHKNASVRKTDPRLSFFRDEVVSGERKDLSEAIGADGGFLVPTEFLATLYGVMAETSVVRQRATVIRMRRRSIEIPVLDQTSTTAGIPHWFGGMQFYWEKEAALKTESDPQFRQIELVAHKLIGYTRASDELVDDSAISIADFLSGPMGMAGGIAWMEDYAFLNGTGAGQPQGVITAGATITVPAAGANLAVADIANMVENFLPSSMGRGVWVISQSLMSDLIQLNGPAGNPSYFWQPSARDGAPGMLMGMPVVWSEKVPLAGTAGAIGLYDFMYYLLGDRQATTIASTQFDRWRYDQTSWRAVHRVDGQPWLSAPLTYQDGTTQVSPFVILGAFTGS